MIKSGDLDRFVSVQKRTVTLDATGGKVTTWKHFANIFASKLDSGGREFRQAGVDNAEVTTLWTTRFVSWLNAADYRLVYQGRVYDIVSIGETERREGLAIGTKARADS